MVTGWMWSGVFAMAIALAAPATAYSQEPAGEADLPLRDRGCCLDDVSEGARVQDLEINGNAALSSSTIRNAIFTTREGRYPWSKRQTLDKSEFINDLQRLHVLYQRNGYFDAELVRYSVERRGDDGVRIVFEIEEGLPTLVDRVAIESFDPATPVDADLIAELPLKVGRVFTEADLQASREEIITAFRARGHAFAEVLLEYRIRKEARTATVTYTVDPGGIYYFGDVTISGLDDARDEALVRSRIAFRRGHLYDPDRLIESQRRLYELGIYRRVDMDAQSSAIVADTIDVQVLLQPAPTHVVRFGIGYGTEDLFRVSASWLDRNLFGNNRQLEVRGQFSQIEREAAVSYRLPFAFVPELSFLTTAFLRFEDETNYTVERLGATARAGYRVSRRLQANAGLTVERDDFSDFDQGVLVPELGRAFINPSRLAFADFRVSYDDTDSLFSPTRGYAAAFDYQIGLPVFSSDYAYHRLTFEVTRYVEVREGWVLAGKVLPGAIFTYGGDPEDGGTARVPLFQRLFAGGATSVRGYERRQLGPKDNPDQFEQSRDPEPIGGNGVLETSVELRFPLAGKIRGAAFIDAGNVWDDPSEITLTDLEYTPGAGLRYATPIGPVRVDVARRMSGAERFLPRWVFHISIGNAF